MMAADVAGAAGKDIILFDAGKRELFNPQSGLRTLHRKLRNNWKFGTVKDEITVEKLADAKIFVIAGPREKFTAAEFDVIQDYIRNGGSVLLMMGEGGETKFETNINFFLEQFGIRVETDSVVRSSYYKFFHPKECVVTNGVVNREISRAAGKSIKKSGENSADDDKLSFVYPYGATLTVQKPAIPVLSSGTVSLPVNRPICAFHGPSTQSKGKLVVFGSCHIFHDQYLEQEENSKVLDVVMQWLTADSFQLDAIDADDPDIADYHYLPHTEMLAGQVRAALQEGDEVPRDFTSLFDVSVFNIDTSSVPEAVEAYDALGVKHEPLRLINPQFETPLPPLAPAVFPPSFREPAAPSLDLFDLDDCFSSERVRLAQLTNKCNDDDLEYYIRECGAIIGVTNKLDKEKRTGKHILEHVFRKIVDFKKLNQG